jgi:hypothetical protein
MSIQSLNPSPVMTGTDYVFSSTYAYSHMPQVAKELTQRFGDQDFFRSVFELIDGGVAPVAGLEYHHLEDNWLTTIIKVDSNSAGATNAAVTLTVQATPTDYNLTFPQSAVSPYIVTGAQTNTSPVSLNMTLDINGVQCQVVDVDQTTNPTQVQFTVVPKVLGEAVPAVTTSTEIIIVGNAWGERTGQPKSMAWRPVLYTNNMQEIKGTFSVSAREMQMEAWIDYPVLGGGTKKLLWSWNALKNYQFYRNMIATTLITGKKTTNTTYGNTANANALTNNATTVTTEGMVPFVQNYGNTYTYSGLTGLQKADWSTITTTYIDKYRGAKEYMALSGIFARNDMSNWMGDSMKNGAINYGMFGGGALGKEKAINYDFDSFQLNGYTFHMKTFDPFNYIQQLGAAGQPYPYRIILIPADRVAATMGDGPRVNVPAARVVYLKHSQAPGAEYMVEWATGAAGGAFTSEIAEFNQYYRSTVGFEGFAGNRWVIIDKQ